MSQISIRVCADHRLDRLEGKIMGQEEPSENPDRGYQTITVENATFEMACQLLKFGSEELKWGRCERAAEEIVLALTAEDSRKRSVFSARTITLSDETLETAHRMLQFGWRDMQERSYYLADKELCEAAGLTFDETAT